MRFTFSLRAGFCWKCQKGPTFVEVVQTHAAVLILIGTTATVIHHNTGESLSEHDIDLTMTYWRNKQKSPAAGRTLNNDSTHLPTMTRLITGVPLKGVEPYTRSGIATYVMSDA